MWKVQRKLEEKGKPIRVETGNGGRSYSEGGPGASPPLPRIGITGTSCPVSTPCFCSSDSLPSVCDLVNVCHRPGDRSQRIGSRDVSAFSLLPRSWMESGVPAHSALWVIRIPSPVVISEYTFQNRCCHSWVSNSLMIVL